jgi:NADPH:quinone reductase-like Zn-dependent oxidoreductase
MEAFYQLSYKRSVPCVYGELPDPVPGENQMLIEVKAVSINPVDYKIKNGDVRLLSGFKFPKIVGSDFAGIVRKPASGDGNFKAGERVYGAVSIFTGKPGTLCELVVTGPGRVRHIPDDMSFEEAASLPVAALTALNGLRRCGVTAGSNLLINGATGGVGHFAVQIAKAKGAMITATCSETNRELAKQLGADKIIGYRREDLAGMVNEYDSILDAWGKMKFADIYRMLKKNGIYASPLILTGASLLSFPGWLLFRKKLTSSNIRSRPEDFEEIERLFIEKKLRPVIENIFPLERAAEAFEMAENGRPRGKVVVTHSPSPPY